MYTCAVAAVIKYSITDHLDFPISSSATINVPFMLNVLYSAYVEAFSELFSEQGSVSCIQFFLCCPLRPGPLRVVS